MSRQECRDEPVRNCRNEPRQRCQLDRGTCTTVPQRYSFTSNILLYHRDTAWQRHLHNRTSEKQILLTEEPAWLNQKGTAWRRHLHNHTTEIQLILTEVPAWLYHTGTAWQKHLHNCTTKLQLLTEVPAWLYHTGTAWQGHLDRGTFTTVPQIYGCTTEVGSPGTIL